MDRLEVIKKLELELVSRETRQNSDRLEQLLSEDFTEIGSSGDRYCRSEIISSLRDANHTAYELSDFTFSEPSAECVLVIYKATVEGRQSYRCSLWTYSDHNWKMIFHQSTPIV